MSRAVLSEELRDLQELYEADLLSGDLAMQKVEGSSPFIRLTESPGSRRSR